MVWRACKNLFLFGIGGFAAFLVIEAALIGVSQSFFGKVLPLIEPQLGTPDPDIGYAFIPGAEGMWTRENRAYIKINSLGLRDREMTREKPGGVFRIALTGDSVTEALQVEQDQVFDNQVEDMFAEEGRKVEIANLAMSGNGPLRQLVRLEKFGLPLKPDLIVMMFSVADFTSGEMLDDSQNPGYKIDQDGNVTRSYGYKNRFSQRYIDKPTGKAFIWLLRHSNLARILNMRRKEPPSKFFGVGLPSFSLSNTPPPDAEDVCNIKSYERFYGFWTGDRKRKGYKVMEQFVSEITVLSREQDIPVLIIPRIGLADRSCPDNIQKREAGMRAMKDHFTSRGIGFADWKKEIAETMGKEPYRDEDIQNLGGFGLMMGSGHLNYRGHRIAAETLYRILEEEIK